MTLGVFMQVTNCTGKRVERRRGVRDWFGLGRHLAAGAAEWLIRRRSERDKGRLALADIDACDLSEFGRRARAEVLRDLRDSDRRRLKAPSGRIAGCVPARKAGRKSKPGRNLETEDSIS